MLVNFHWLEIKAFHWKKNTGSLTKIYVHVKIVEELIVSVKIILMMSCTYTQNIDGKNCYKTSAKPAVFSLLVSYGSEVD